MGWFRSFNKEFVGKTKNQTEGLKTENGWQWTEDMDREFAELKETIKDMDNLYPSNYNKPFILRTYVSNTCIGALLYQEGDNGEHRPNEWSSKNLHPQIPDKGSSERRCWLFTGRWKNLNMN